MKRNQENLNSKNAQFKLNISKPRFLKIVTVCMFCSVVEQDYIESIQCVQSTNLLSVRTKEITLRNTQCLADLVWNSLKKKTFQSNIPGLISIT